MFLKLRVGLMIVEIEDEIFWEGGLKKKDEGKKFIEGRKWRKGMIGVKEKRMNKEEVIIEIDWWVMDSDFKGGDGIKKLNDVGKVLEINGGKD